ncbi:Gp19/Gp15/Gp42 family protein [Nocardioides ochotonae]|uniref:Gp19/Gp15/Gp42 family protein n=1 Tax=Nocardioides ochotonae TaxID=2685869 RepID=UPI00174E46CE|nr:Gp19/Gp15/Gp42 family protein [Nocardioides ochotonae]
MALLWSTVSDVSDRWIGDPVPATPAQIETLLGDAEDLIVREFPDMPDRIEAGAVPLARVRRVAARVVIRHLRNPDGIRSRMEGAGPFQKNTTYGGDDPGALVLTDEDRADLGGTKSRRAYQIDMVPALPADAARPLWRSSTSWEDL